MTQDEIIRMAREAGFIPNGQAERAWLERFAALVAAHERNRHAWTQEHWTEYEHAIAAAERERCALVCITLGDYYAECDDFEAEDVAHACASSIRESEK